MNVPQFLGAASLCTALAASQGAIASAADATAATPAGRESISVQKMEDGRDGGVERGGVAAATRGTSAGTPKSSGARGTIAPARGVRTDVHGNSGRLRALLSTQAHRQPAPQPNRRTVASHDMTDPGEAVALRRSGTSSPFGSQSRTAQSAPKTSTQTSRSSTAANTLARQVLLGRSQRVGLAQVGGGPAAGGTPHNATLDGGRLHHKF